MSDPAPGSDRPATPQAPPRRSPWTLVLGGVALAVMGGIGLVLADMYAPTVANAMTRGRLLTPESHAVLQATSFLAVVGGILMACAGAIRRNRASGRP